MRTRRASRGFWSTCGLFAGLWLGGLLFYWWLIAKLQGQQMGAAALVGLAVAVALLAVGREARLQFRPELKGFQLLLVRLPGKVLRDLGLLAVELVRACSPRHHGTGALQEIPFNPGGRDARSAARRALVLTGVSVAPNSVAICVEPDKEALRIHQLVFRPEPPTDRDYPL